MMTLWILIGAVALIVLYFIATYNGLVGAKNQVKNAWSQIDVQLKRRYDLIPNLIEAVKGYMAHERGTLETITAARSRAMGAESIAEKGRAEGALSNAVSRLLVTVENYPDLKANQNFIGLQEELSSTENKIAFSRQNYNDQVLFYNNRIQMFPSSIVAGLGRFTPQEFFETDDKAARETPKVKF